MASCRRPVSVAAVRFQRRPPKSLAGGTSSFAFAKPRAHATTHDRCQAFRREIINGTGEKFEIQEMLNITYDVKGSADYVGEEEERQIAEGIFFDNVHAHNTGS